jgi:hypothetical protein
MQTPLFKAQILGKHCAAGPNKANNSICHGYIENSCIINQFTVLNAQNNIEEARQSVGASSTGRRCRSLPPHPKSNSSRSGS